MKADELRSSMLSKGYVESPNGWVHASRLGDKGDRRPSEQVTQGQSAQDQQGPAAKLPCAELQKLEADRDDGKNAVPDYQKGIQGVDGEGSATFRIDVVIRVSNRVRRDPTGAFETICDLITATRRRLRERLDGRIVESGSRPARKRRRKNNDHKADVKSFDESKVPF